MDSKKFAQELSGLVTLVPPIAYGVLLANSHAFIELIICSFLFFAFIPNYIAEQITKLPRNPKNKRKMVWQFLLSYAAGFAIQWAFNAPGPVLAFSISLVVGHFLAYLITPHWMISTHAMLIAQPLTVLLLQSRIESIFLVAIFILMGWARVRLKAHTPLQYLTGGAVGAALTLVAMVSSG